jgi:hypothetical protein
MPRYPVVLVSLALAGCTVADPPVDRVTWLAQRASEVRELDYLGPVPVAQISQQAFAAGQAEAAADIEDAELEEYAQTWGRLGFFPVDAELREPIAHAKDWVGAYYSAEDGAITLVGSASDSIVVHEFVHALQDQTFDLVEYHDVETSDAGLASRAVTEGDATLAESRFGLQEQGGDLQHASWRLQEFREWSESLLVEAPIPVLLATPAFVYSRGLEFCLANLTGYTIDDPHNDAPPYSWALENQLFGERRPRTSWHVLSRTTGDPAEQIGLSEPPEHLVDRLEAIETDSLGAWYGRVLLGPVDGAVNVGDVPVLMEEWTGDRVLFVRDRETGAHGHVWAAAWRSDDAAARFAEAVRTLHGATLDSPETPTLGTASDGELVWIERRDRRVVVVKNVEADIAAGLAGAVYGDAVAPDAGGDPGPPDSAPAPDWRGRGLKRWLDRLVGQER